MLESMTGRSDAHIDFMGLEKPVHKGLVEPFLSLRDKASSAGFDLRIASGFRDFERQRVIWNMKVEGQKPVLGTDGGFLRREELSAQELLFAILRWSALPGASRHHWGTDIDVFDANRIAPEQLQLVVPEYVENGPCADLFRWLQVEIKSDEFFWPYREDRGGVAVEPWHLSYRPLATDFENSLSLNALVQVIESAEIGLKEEILANIDQIYHQFVLTG